MATAIDRRDWNRTDDTLPMEGEIVETKIHDVRGIRNEQKLRRLGRLWFHSDGSMYVYYTPIHWRYPDGDSS